MIHQLVFHYRLNILLLVYLINTFTIVGSSKRRSTYQPTIYNQWNVYAYYTNYGRGIPYDRQSTTNDVETNTM